MDKMYIKAFYDLMNNEDFKLFIDFLQKKKQHLVELLISCNDDEVRGKIKCIDELLFIFNKDNINKIYEKATTQNTYYG